MPSEALFGNSTYQVDYFYHETPSRFLAVTLTHVGVDRLDGFGFAGNFLCANGFDVVAVKSTADLWYQDFPDDAVVAIQRILNFPYAHKASYGSSMGAYASIYFTQKLELDTALAISPQYDITVEKEKRWQDAAAKIDDMKTFNYKNVVNGKCRYVIIFDPKLPEEMLHIDPYRREIPGSIRSRADRLRRFFRRTVRQNPRR